MTVDELPLELGLDTDADADSFDGLVGNIFIQNYSVTYDDKVDVVVPSTWSGTDDGTDIVFTQTDQTITFERLGGERPTRLLHVALEALRKPVQRL